MACIIAFLGVAVFTSLHKHQGAAKRCSLNGFDQLASGGAEQSLVLPVSISFEWREASHAALPEALRASSPLHLRGPPAAL
jgi:hypothetical protein